MNIQINKLIGKYVYLEKLTPEHVERIRPMARDERIWEFNKGLLIDDTFNQQFDKYISNALDPNGRGQQHTFVILEVSTKAIIGMTRLYEIEEKDKHASIGYTWYIPSVWGKVHNKECKLLLLQYIFDELKFHRAEFTVAHQNIRSQKAVEKIGGVKEGVLRKHGYRNDGTLKDTVIFSIIDDEWPTVKEKLTRLVQDSENVS